MQQAYRKPMSFSPSNYQERGGGAVEKTRFFALLRMTGPAKRVMLSDSEASRLA
jgi:hypothetical protein